MIKKLKGTVLDEVGGGFYLIKLETGKNLRCYLSGKMKKHHIRVLVGDKVEITWPRPGNIGRITKRL